ncbi:MAG: hypothetical protein KAJ14_10565 [Candidatus Omnitrophica bacterium]|nr:hypothetical protein [Candidatus Omnitrophota bacterium]
MKQIKCQSIAKSTQKQCERTPLSDSSYCWLHYPKKETIEFFILGILLTFFFQILFTIFTISSEEEKIDQLQQEVNVLSTQNRELIEGKNTLIIQNEELSAKLDKYQKNLNEKEQEIADLNQKNTKLAIRQNQHAFEISKVKNKEKVNTFKALDDTRMKDIVHQVSGIKRRHDLDLHISIYYLVNSHNRMKVGKELESIFRKAGFSTYSNNMIMAGSPVDKNNILLECSNSNRESFKEILGVLQKMLTVVFDWKETKDEKEVKFTIIGVPQFKNNGVIYFKEK